MLEFRFVEHFNRNYNTIDVRTERRVVIATFSVFKQLASSVEFCRCGRQSIQ